ncbi:hypothetical protein SAMN05216299_110126 [Nitrosospira sp. Nsp14]|nr:hypothetical protein SAMN05216299_110126 [Nitrosospira sp. Nsp14]
MNAKELAFLGCAFGFQRKLSLVRLGEWFAQVW